MKLSSPKNQIQKTFPIIFNDTNINLMTPSKTSRNTIRFKTKFQYSH